MAEAVADLKNITYRAFRKVLRRNAAYVAERSVPERLADLDVPVLVIFGAADPPYEPSSAHQYDAVPTARVEMLPGVSRGGAEKHPWRILSKWTPARACARGQVSGTGMRWSGRPSLARIQWESAVAR
ncbi:MAG: alpha/beta fold hydrolase [Micromonosporaceae bacterium]